MSFKQIVKAITNLEAAQIPFAGHSVTGRVSEPASETRPVSSSI